MEKGQAEKKGSFSFLKASSNKPADKSPVQDVAEDPLPDTSLDDVLREVDLFLIVLSSTDDKSIVPQSPIAAEALPAKVDAMVAKADGGGEDDDDDDMPLVEAVGRLATLHDLLGEFGSEKCSLHNAVLQKAMSFLEKRMCTLMEDYMGSKALKTKSFSKNPEPDRAEDSSSGLPDFPGYPEPAVLKMRKIATVMISAGYESNCCQIYHVTRQKALKSVLNRFGLEKIGVDDVQKLSWEALEDQISSCIEILKACASAYFPAERKLCQSIFFDYPEVYFHEYTHLGKAVITRLLNFIEAVTTTKRSTDKLFKFLDTYECLRDVMPGIENSYLECGVDDLVAEVSSAKERLAEAVMAIFSELEKSIKSDSGRTPVPSGTVHPSTRYIMNYLKYVCEYKNTLEQVFTRNQSSLPPEAEEATPNDDGTAKTSPFAVQLIKIMDLLDETLEMKSTLYKDASLRLVFLMNNGRYILQKIKGSEEIHEVVGDNNYRRRSSEVRKHHKNYTRETWGRLLQILAQHGLQVTNGKLNNKPLLKERLKSFNNMFEEIHKTQSTWVVCDEQLQSEMRAAIAAVVIPAYRSFLGRFQQFLDPGRQTEKYVKYQPEDIETLIDGLFDGNPSTIGRKTKH